MLLSPREEQSWTDGRSGSAERMPQRRISSAPACRCARGEIDIIALDGDTLVLVEVKTRTTVARGTPEESVSATKQRRIARLAEAYLTVSGAGACAVRFDVVSIRVLGPDRALLRHHRAAFVVE